MAGDRPSFMTTIPDEDSDKEDPMDVLREGIDEETPQDEPQDTPAEEPTEEPVEEGDPDDSPDPVEEDDDNEEIDEDDPGEEPDEETPNNEDEGSDDEEPGDEPAGDDEKTDSQRIEELEKQIQELKGLGEEGQGKDDEPQDEHPTYITEEQLKQAVSTPLIPYEQPTMDSFYLDNGNFDVEGFVGASIRNALMSVQKEMFSGGLGAVNIALARQTISQDNRQRMSQKEAIERATEIQSELYKDYPILEEDEELAGQFQMIIMGAKQNKARELAAEGKSLEGQDLTLEEYKSLANKFLGKRVGDGGKKAPKEPVPEKPKGGPGLSGKSKGKQPKDSVSSKVDEMITATKNKKSLF